MSHLKTQYAESFNSDFDKKTWTLEMKDSNFVVTDGNFAIIPKQQYQKLLTAIHSMRNCMNVHPDCEPHSEFSDMVSRVDEILDQI